VEQRLVGPFTLSAVGVGTAPMGADSSWYVTWPAHDDRQAIAAIHAALAEGVNWIDTAPFYGWGRAEEIVGRALASIRRDDVCVFTKCGTFRNPDGTAREDHRRDSIRADLEASLRRLRIDHVDLLQLHDPDSAVPIEDSWATIHDLIGEGKVRHGGLSNHSNELVERALRVGPVAMRQHQLSLLARAGERDAVPFAEAHGIGVLCWSPLASGFLAGGFDVDALDEGDFRRRHAFASLELAPLRDALSRIADRHGRTPAQVAIAWVLSRSESAAAIVGVTNEREAAELTGAADLLLADEELHALETAAPSG
jgi:aryl-alcohol dehydrogenase-like predicted oxidoreductase